MPWHAIPDMARERIISGEAQGEEEAPVNFALRPQKFDQYVGQEPLIRKLRIAVKAMATAATQWAYWS